MLGVMPRLDRGIQYAVASRLNHGCLGVLGDFNRSSQHLVYRSPAAIRREFLPVFSSPGSSEAWC
ncbi:hypothetical protein CVM73_37295 [Bradyrhizobium forestalis]|uniref:Uncharacterized protein n=1 Tax=Bradyrhizobium forestalis TaxID=1419263 RepID=A0A2M8QXF7_9BRAD|nr:hypothetical protein CVM73_37295 [Bradyrhizobium forestalis]